MLSRPNHIGTKKKGKVGDESSDDVSADAVAAEEGELIDRTLAGDAEAYGVLVCRYQNRLYNTAVHIIGSHEEARDVVQEAFVQAFVKLHTFQRSAAFYTWLYRIAFNLWIGRKRRDRRRRSLEQAKSFAGGEPAEKGPGPSAPMESVECVSQVRAALGQLAGDHREVLLLREMEGCSYEEISRILDLPVGTVRSRLHRARARLKEHLLPLYIEQLK